MPFCYSPWTNIDISPQGEIMPCCKFQKQYYDQQFNIQTHSVSEYSNSKLVNDLKQEFQQGTWPVGCERCRIEESNGIESKRQLDYARWKNHYDSYDLADSKFITTSIAFGNTCNLKCITCGPHSSSRWQKEYRELYGKDIPHFKFYKKNFVNEFIEQAPSIVHLDIPGGEPFLSGTTEQKELLTHYIEHNRAGNISLHYTTNLTVFPDSEWWDLWKHFKEVDIQLSIDGVGARYEYIRYPAAWNDVLVNTENYIKKQKESHNIKLSVSHTVSAYNVFYLDEFFSWCYNMGLSRPWAGRVHNPVHMRPEVWPESVAMIIVNQLSCSQHADVQTWAKLMKNANHGNQFDQFREKLHAHDLYRGTNFAKVFSELSNFV